MHMHLNVDILMKNITGYFKQQQKKIQWARKCDKVKI